MVILQFMRISRDEDPEVVLDCMTKEWNLDLPKLVVSVIGGEKGFRLTTLKEDFQTAMKEVCLVIFGHLIMKMF